MERSARVSDSWKKEKKKQLVVFQRVQCTDINFYSLARKCVKREPAPFGYCYYNRATEKSKDLPLRKFVPRSRFFKIWDEMFKIGKEFFDRSTNDTFFTRNILDEIPIHLPNATYRSISRVKFVSLPPQLKMHRKYTLWTNDARGQRETISSAPEIPASLPHYGSIVGYNRRFFLNEQYRPKIYRLDFEIEVSHERECAKLVRDNLIQILDGRIEKKKKRKSKKKRSINQRNVSTRMHRCTRSLRGNKQANIKISRGWNGKRE